jgi:hypothetical protein
LPSVGSLGDTNSVFTSIACSADGNTVIVADANGPAGISISTDAGNRWTSSDPYQEWNLVACSADGTKRFAAIIEAESYFNSGPILTYWPYTTPGGAGYLSCGPFSAIELQYVGNQQWLPLSSSGNITMH